VRTHLNAASVALGLAIVSGGVLIYFIHHIATAIQADFVITTVSAELYAAIDQLFPDAHGSISPDLNTLLTLCLVLTSGA
jgi:uncharacterized membrane protein